MGVLKQMYDKLADGSITVEERKALHSEVIKQHQKDDTPTGLFAPDSCPCEYGMCGECISIIVSP